MKNVSINDLREHLFKTIEDLKGGRIDIDKSKAIAELGQVIVNSARLEVDAMKIISSADNTQMMKDAIKHSFVISLEEPKPKVQDIAPAGPVIKMAPAGPVEDAIERVVTIPEKKRLGRPPRQQVEPCSRPQEDDQETPGNKVLFEKAFTEKGYNAILGY